MKRIKFALAAVAVAISTFTLQPQPAGAETIIEGLTVLSSSMWGPNNVGLKYVVAEIRNDTSSVVTNVQWVLEYRDSNGQLICRHGSSCTENSFGAWFERLGPGEQAPIFSIPPTQASSYRIVAVGGDTTLVAPNRNFSVTVDGQHPSFFDPDYSYISGTVTNRNDVPVQDVHVILTCYGLGGIRDQADDWVGWSSNDKTLDPGETR